MEKVRLSLLLFFGCGLLYAQEVVNNESIDVSAVEYLNTVDIYSPLYYGKEQENYHYLMLNHPTLRTLNHSYLVDSKYEKSRLSYRNVIYPEVLLRLELYRDELIVLAPDFRNIVLIPESVDFVEMHGQKIIYFTGDSLPGCPANGYYVIVHSGNCLVLKKQGANLMTSASSIKLEYFFTFFTKYYLLKDDTYHSIKNRRTLLNVLQPHKRELKRFMSSNKLNFRQNADILISQTVKEYEKISNKQ